MGDVRIGLGKAKSAGSELQVKQLAAGITTNEQGIPAVMFGDRIKQLFLNRLVPNKILSPTVVYSG
uniref:Uncharacterized protein n=1 Tax=Parascaris equorum TaxID=6256 RepID=A0A914RGR7_PAREQ